MNKMFSTRYLVVLCFYRVFNFKSISTFSHCVYRFFFGEGGKISRPIITFYNAIVGIAIATSYLKCYFFVSRARKFDSARSVLTRIRRVFRRSRREKLMRTRVAQIRRKTDYLRGALSRLMAHPRKRCFL